MASTTTSEEGSYGILPPSSISAEQPSNLTFYTSPSSSSDQPSSSATYLSDHADAGSIARPRREGGRATRYLESKGFGWLMEVEEEEEEKPLL